MKAVMGQMGVFEGPENAKVLTNRLDLIRDGMYRKAGQFIRWSVQQGGPGLPYLWSTHYRLVAGKALGESGINKDIRAIPDFEVQDHIGEVIPYMYIFGHNMQYVMTIAFVSLIKLMVIWLKQMSNLYRNFDNYFVICLQLQAANSEEDYKKVVTEKIEWLTTIGVCNTHKQNLDNRQTLVQDIIMHYLYYRSVVMAW